MQQNSSHKLEQITSLVDQIQTTKSLIEFETIELPFQLVEAGINLWASTFSPEVLRQLASSDADTLDAWAIALSQTLTTQLNLLNNWLPHLANLPVPPKLKQQISDRILAIGEIASKKSTLLQTAADLLSQEQELRQNSNDLQRLTDKEKELQKIQAELQQTDIEILRQNISDKAAFIEPQMKALRDLQQQKADLDNQIAALQRQQTTLREEITYWQSRQNHLESNTTDTVAELISLTQVQRERLSEALSKELVAVEQQRTELIQQQASYHQAQQQLQKAREDFQKYQTATEEIITAVTTHYQADQALGSLLPIDRQKVDTLFRTCQQTLAEIDQELASARRKNEQAQQKSRIFF